MWLAWVVWEDDAVLEVFSTFLLLKQGGFGSFGDTSTGHQPPENVLSQMCALDI